MEEKYKLNWTRSAIDVLVRARLVRCSPYPDQRISFVHRRFNEYFLALAAQENLMSVDLESIANDRRDRDALVLYVELADDAEAARILRFCWNEIREREAESTSVDTVGTRDDNNKIRATYCLRFLVDGFASSKRRLVEKIGGEFCALLSDAVANHHSNMLRAKIAVEAAGILPDWEASEVIFRALQSGNYWIMETAIRSARNVQNISAQSLGLIRRQFWEMSEAEIFRKRRDFVDLFRLNPSFRSLSLIINLRTLAAFCQWPLRVSAILVFPVLYLISITAILGLTFYLVFVGIATDDIIERRKKGSSNRSRARKVWSIITWMMRVDTVFVVAFGLYLLFRIINLFIVFPGPEFGTSVLFRHMPPYDSPIALAMIGGCVSVNMWASLMRMLVRVHVVGQRVREVVCFVIERARRLTIKELAIGAGVLIGLGIIEAAFFYLTSKYSIVGWCVGGVVTIGFIWFVANALRTFFSEWVYVDRLPVTKLETRRSIAEIFIGLRSSYLRGRLVNKVEEYHRRYGSRPKDIWPQGAAPNLGDRASIRLSQLDAVWAGLER
jgi:hypothetical protein